MKKVYCLLIALCILLNSFGILYAQGENELTSKSVSNISYENLMHSIDYDNVTNSILKDINVTSDMKYTVDMIDWSQSIKLYDDTNLQYDKVITGNDIQALPHYWIVYVTLNNITTEYRVFNESGIWIAYNMQGYNQHYIRLLDANKSLLSDYSAVYAVGVIAHPNYPMLMCVENESVQTIFLLHETGKYGALSNWHKKLIPYEIALKEIKKESVLTLWYRAPGKIIWAALSIVVVVALLLLILKKLSMKHVDKIDFQGK